LTYIFVKAVNAGDAYTYIYIREALYDEVLIYVKCITNNAIIVVEGSFDGSTYDVTLQSATTITAGASPTIYRLTERYPYVRIGYKNATAGQTSVVTIGYNMKGGVEIIS
jgi:hypothetical protein